MSILRLLRRSENSINFALLLNFILANVLVSFKFISIFSLSWILLPFPVPFVFLSTFGSLVGKLVQEGSSEL